MGLAIIIIIIIIQSVRTTGLHSAFTHSRVGVATQVGGATQEWAG